MVCFLVKVLSQILVLVLILCISSHLWFRRFFCSRFSSLLLLILSFIRFLPALSNWACNHSSSKLVSLFNQHPIPQSLIYLFRVAAAGENSQPSHHFDTRQVFPHSSYCSHRDQARVGASETEVVVFFGQRECDLNCGKSARIYKIIGFSNPSLMKRSLAI